MIGKKPHGIVQVKESQATPINMYLHHTVVCHKFSLPMKAHVIVLGSCHILANVCSATCPGDVCVSTGETSPSLELKSLHH